jgi:hypothetical protein
MTLAREFSLPEGMCVATAVFLFSVGSFALLMRLEAFTDNGLKHLGPLAQLRYLSLASTQVTDVGLKQLRGLPRLNWLDLSNTQVTDAGVAERKKALPNLTVTLDTQAKPDPP